MSNNRDVVLAWQLSDQFGWGIAGLNIFMNFVVDKSFRPSMLYAIESNQIAGLDPLRKKILQKDFDRSNVNSKLLQENLNAPHVEAVKVDCPVVHCMGNGLQSSSSKLKGSSNIGRLVFEGRTPLDAKERLKEYDAIVVASQWNMDVIQSLTNVPVYLNHEGVDRSLFSIMPKSSIVSPELFCVFSGGKPELRKGQDLVLAAFKIFSENKSNVRLVTAWHSPWLNISRNFCGILDSPLKVKNEKLDIIGWAVDNGISHDKIIDLGMISNSQAARVLSEMDCTLQLSRCEGGTNFVAMEAMACGVPTILSACTGHLDICKIAPAIPVASKLGGCKLDGAFDFWGEPDIDEVVYNLNILYEYKMNIRPAGRYSEFQRSWSDHSTDLAKIIQNFT